MRGKISDKESNNIATQYLTSSRPFTVALTTPNCNVKMHTATKRVSIVLSALFMPLDACNNASASSFIALRHSTRESRYGLMQKKLMMPEAIQTSAWLLSSEFQKVAKNKLEQNAVKPATPMRAPLFFTSTS